MTSNTMDKMMSKIDGIQGLSSDEAQAIVGGPTAIPYAVMMSLIIVICISAISFFGRGWGR